MCNKLHEDSEPILPTGYGWKIFRRKKFYFAEGGYSESFEGMISWSDRYNLDPLTSYVRWDPSLAYTKGDVGFCFFTTKMDADWGFEYCRHFFSSEYVLKRIHYCGGLGSHIDKDFCSCRIALCRAFIIVDDEEGICLKI